MSDDTTKKRLKKIGDEFVEASQGRYLKCVPLSAQGPGNWNLCFELEVGNDECALIVFHAHIKDDEIRAMIRAGLARFTEGLGDQ